MSLEKKDASFIEMKEMKRKMVVSSVIAENLVVTKRVLRSDVAKQRKKVAEEANYIVGRDDIDGRMYDKELNVEKSRVLRLSNGKNRELSKNHLKKSFKEVVVGDHEGNEAEVRTCEGTLSLDVAEKTKVDETRWKNFTLEDDIEAQKDSNIGTDAVKCGRKNGIEDKRAIDEGGNSENIVTEDAPFGSDCDDASNLKREDEAEPTSRERNGTEGMLFDEVIKVECKAEGFDVNEHGKSDDTNDEVASVELASKTGKTMISAVRTRKKKANIMDENRRFTRSSAAKLKVDHDTYTTVTSAISKRACIKIEKKIVGSSVGKKKFRGRKIEVGKREVKKSDAAKQKNGTDANKKRKKFMESGLDCNISKEAPVTGTSTKKNKTDSASCKHYQTEEVQEGKKLLTRSLKIHRLKTKEAVSTKIHKNVPSDKRIKSTFKKSCRLQGERVKWSKQLVQMTLEDLKPNVCALVGFGKKDFIDYPHRKLKTQGIECGSISPTTNKKTLGSKKSHIHMVRRKTSSIRAGIRTGSLSPLKESKLVDASGDSRAVMIGGESTSHLTKKEKDAELRMARIKLRNQIKRMLFNAGWKLELRPRNGKNSLDAVYVTPNGYTHWSILKAYYAFQKQFSCEHDDEGKHKPRKPYEESQMSSFPSFSPIPEEVLSILKRRIIRRRTYKEIAEANMKLGISNTSQKVKKFIEDKIFQEKCGKHKRRGKKVSLLSSRAKGAVNSADNRPYQRKYKRKQKGNALLVRSFNQDIEASTDVYVPYAWKRTTLSWIIDSGVVPENAVVKYMNQRRTKSLLKGHITRDGIHCGCCSKIFTVSDFEIHAGSKQRKPYHNILVEEAGTSLLQCQINAWEKQDESERRGFYSVDNDGDDPNDDTCGICGDGGDLVCCDGCPSTFHQSCLGTEVLPSGNWYCVNCSCRYCVLNSGIVSQENGGTDSPLLSCSQCQKKYHETCIPVEDAVNVSSRWSSILFCGKNCKKLFEKLQMLLGVKNLMDEGFSWTIVQRFNDGLPELVGTFAQRTECNSKVAVALAVMDECFCPIIDKRSGINLIHNVVYNCGSNFSRLNYSSFYTFILERNDEIISVASVRIHGNRVAEMPFIGTRNMHRRQGMCRRLLNKIETVLHSLNIEKLFIPAISELMGTWTNVFGFKLLKVSEREEIRSTNLLVFPGTGLLVKRLMEKDSTIEHCNSIDKDQFETEAAHEVILHPSVEPKPNDFIDLVELQIEHSGHRFSIPDSMESPSNVPSKVSGAFVNFQAPEIKSLNNAAPKDLSSQPDAVSDEREADDSLT